MQSMNMSWAVNRRFERTFPGIADSERRYNQTLLAEWRGQAELQRKSIEQETRGEIEGTLLGTFVYDLENKTEEFIKSEDLWT
jgi:hypothetical protein